MSDLSVGSSATMVQKSHDIQETSIMKLINGGAAPMESGQGAAQAAQVRSSAMQEQGIGQNLNTTA